jgi:hypothetical protein
MTTSRQPKGIPVGGQFAAQAHQESGVALLSETPSRSELIETLKQFDTDTRAQKQALREATREIETNRGKVGAALAALELKKAFPTGGAIRFDRISSQGQGVAVNPEVLEEDGSSLYRNGPFDSMLSAPDGVREPLERALSHISSVRDEDLEAQGFEKVQRPHGTVYELNFENALTLAAARGIPSDASPMDQTKALDLSTLPPGQDRTLGPEEHGLPGVETLTITNLGPNTKFPDRNVISFTYTLPAAANIRDLYDFDDRSRSDAYWAARYAAADLLGCKEFPEIERNGLPGDGVSLEDDGNVIFRQHDYFRPGEAVDPEDLRSWTDDLRQFSEPEARRRLESAITERYNED